MLSITESVGLSVGYSPVRPWCEQWRKIQRAFQTIETYCRRESYPGNEPVKIAFDNFFEECFKLADWLGGDPNAPDISKYQARQYVKNDRDLHICSGFAITSKHYERDSASVVAGRISSIGYDQAAVYVEVEWSEKGQTITEDALALARRCVTAWEAYLKTHQLQSPI